MQLFDPITLAAFALAALALSQPFQLLAATKGVNADETKKFKDSQKATENWLSLVDAGEYEKSWDTASKVLQLTVPRLQWKQILDQIRKPEGKMISRKITDVRTSKDPHGLPPGEYMVYVYETKFAKKDKAFEMLTLVFDEDKWQIMTYQVN